MTGKIIDVAWRSGIDAVCIVAVDYGRYWQAYIGASRMVSIYLDPMFSYREAEHHTTTENRTAEHGCKLDWKEAHAFFPQLDIEFYKTFPKEQK
jgi:hypothetical protein